MIKNKIISLPFIFMVIFGAGCLLFFCSIFVIENMIGAPSSTSSLIIIPMIPISVIAALVGGVFGYFVEGIIKLFKKGEPLQIKEIYFSGIFLSFIVLGIAFFIPLKLQLTWNAHNSPRTIINTGLIKKSSFGPETKIKSINDSARCVVQFEKRHSGGQLFWNSKTFSAKFAEHRFMVFEENGKHFIMQPLEGYDYIRELICFSFNMDTSSEPLLVVIADLRATSGNSIIHFFSSNGECVYQELIERVNSIYLGKELPTGEAIVVLERCNSEKFLYKTAKT